MAIMEKCAKCGAEANIWSEGAFFCEKCAMQFSTCAMCVHGTKCEFQTNPSEPPQFVAKTIQKQTRMGHVIQTVQVPNPERIKMFCLDGSCVCYNTLEDKQLCFKEFGTCKNYKEIDFKEKTE